MQFRHVAASAVLAGLVGAQDQCINSALAINSCATPCIISQAESMGCTGELDFGCECSHLVEIAAACALPIALSCEPIGIGALEVLGSANALCSCVTSADMAMTNTDVTTTGASTEPTGVISVPTGVGSSTPSTTAAPTGVGSSTRLSITPLPGSDPISSDPVGRASTTAITSKNGSVSAPIGSKTSASMQLSHFTGAGATMSAFVPVGGIMGAIVGLLAYL